MVQEGENGFLVPVRDEKELAIAIKKLIDNPDLLITMGKKSRLIAEQEFSIDQVVSKTLDIYSKIGSDPKL